MFMFDDLNKREKRRRNKLAAIRYLFKIFFQNSKKNYIVSEFVTIYEMLDVFRGQCSFWQYIKNKPAKYRVKMYVLWCVLFYTCKLDKYVEKQPEGSFCDNSIKSVIEIVI